MTQRQTGPGTDLALEPGRDRDRESGAEEPALEWSQDAVFGTHHVVPGGTWRGESRQWKALGMGQPGHEDIGHAPRAAQMTAATSVSGRRKASATPG